MECGFDCGGSAVDWAILIGGMLVAVGLARWRRASLAVAVPLLFCFALITFAGGWPWEPPHVAAVLLSLLPLAAWRWYPRRSGAPPT